MPKLIDKNIFFEDEKLLKTLVVKEITILTFLLVWFMPQTSCYGDDNKMFDYPSLNLL